MSAARDPRLTPARLDLAAAHLEGEVEAERFVAGEDRGSTPRSRHRRSMARP
jgi:hypothetical protein